MVGITLFIYGLAIFTISLLYGIAINSMQKQIDEIKRKLNGR